MDPQQRTSHQRFPKQWTPLQLTP